MRWNKPRLATSVATSKRTWFLTSRFVVAIVGCDWGEMTEKVSSNDEGEGKWEEQAKVGSRKVEGAVALARVQTTGSAKLWGIHLEMGQNQHRQ